LPGVVAWWKWILGSLTVAGLLAVAPSGYTALRYSGEIRPADQVPGARVAIVFGAGLRRNGQASPVLYDRVATAAELYRRGKVQTLLLSGDNRYDSYNEPAAMRQAALELGVPEAALVLDYAGTRTYDTCYRAKVIFGVTEAVLVTQAFHLPRALFICDGLGIRASGVAADRRAYLKRSLVVWHLREVFATLAAWWDIQVARPTPVLGEPLPIQ
jgi:SanA protein